MAKNPGLTNHSDDEPSGVPQTPGNSYGDFTAASRQATSEGASKAHLQPVISLPMPCTQRGLELLAVQPVTLAGMSPQERDAVIVTAVADAAGREHVISRFGDSVWDLSSEMEAKNRRTAERRIVWPVDAPKALLDDTKAVLYCALRRGRHGKTWSASAVATAGRVDVPPLLRHLAELGLSDFSQVRALHVADHISELRRTLKPQSVYHRLLIIDLVWSFPMDVVHPLPEHPWGGQALYDATGVNEIYDGPASRAGRTPVIPRSVQRTLFSYCESLLDSSEELFIARDAGEITASSGGLIAIRDAVLYLLQVTSGMRNSESTGVTNGCWRIDRPNGVTFHWVRTREFKTTGGTDVEFLVPPEAIRALEILTRYAEPLQIRLRDEGRWIEGLLAACPAAATHLSNGVRVADAVQRLNHVRLIEKHMVLGISTDQSDHLGSGSRVEVLSGQGCGMRLKQLAEAAGTDWSLSNHQCRRTFAYNVANSRLGRMGLVFLKWQLKHASMSWTQLYAANPHQDHPLYREFEEEMFDARLDLMEGWAQPDAQLSGGAGKKIMQTRTRAARDFEQLLRQTAESVDLRSTGHAWCISGTRGCHGQGVYDPSMCAGCSQAVIDREQSTAWQMIHLDNLRLATITDCGPAVVERARKAVERSTQVLMELGVSLPTNESARAYMTGLGGA